MRVVFLLAILCTGLLGVAQDGLVKGSSYEKKWMAPEKYQMTWYMQRDTQLLEMGVVKTEISVEAKLLTVITTVRMKNAKSDWVDSSVAMKSNFKPLYHSSYNTQRDIVLKFGKVVQGVYYDKMKNKSIIVSDTTNKDYFDSNLYPYLVRLLPLKEGFSASIPIYDFNPDGKQGVLNAYVKNVSSGTLSLHGKEKEVWVLTVTDELGQDSTSFTTYYIGKQDRKLFKQEINIRGRKMVMLLNE